MKKSRLDDLKTQRENLQAFLNAAPGTERALIAELEEMENQRDAAEAMHLRTGRRESLDEVEAKAASVRESLAAQQRRVRIAASESNKLDAEIAREETRAAKQWEEVAFKIADQVVEKLRRDDALRRDIVDLFATFATCPGTVNWDAVLSDVFPRATDSELSKALPAARAKIQKALQ